MGSAFVEAIQFIVNEIDIAGLPGALQDRADIVVASNKCT